MVGWLRILTVDMQKKKKKLIFNRSKKYKDTTIIIIIKLLWPIYNIY